MQNVLRNRLIQLICEVPRKLIIRGDEATGETYQAAHDIADHLIAKLGPLPPCKVGDTVYEVGLKNDCSGLRVIEREVSKIEITKDGVALYYCDWREHERIGLYYLTREDAEKAIPESEDVDNA